MMMKEVNTEYSVPEVCSDWAIVECVETLCDLIRLSVKFCQPAGDIMTVRPVRVSLTMFSS